ncbi:MAG TPA: heparinase II/III family protein [Sphingomonadaceae bacterium]|nr:heparinase II/III family protein [Sphingomonadaceae bacterium]
MDQHGTQQRLALDGDPAVDLDSDDLAIPLHDAAPEPTAIPHPSAAPRKGASEIGRELVLSDFSPPSTNAGERLIRFAYRIGISGSTLSAPLRKPARTRLLATVETPLAGDRVAGIALRAGHFLVHGIKAPIAQMDFAPAARLTPPFERVVHGFEWLRDLAASGAREQCIATAEQVLGLWLEANPRPGKGAAWQVGNAGHRLLNWLVHGPLIFSGADKMLRAKALEATAETARWLDRNVGRAPDRLAEAVGWSAIIAAGLLLPDGKPRRLFGEAGLARALGEAVGEDGGVLSRSPLGQIELVALLVDLSACYRATRREPPQAIETMLGLLVPPLLGVLHGDGGLGNWQGAGSVSAERISTLIDASGVRTRPLKDVRQWGYQRISAGKTVLQFDAAPPPLARHARSGCASTLAFELSDRAQRIVVNCGGAALAGGQVPVRIESGLRATAAHSTLVLDDSNSTAVLINGKLGAGVNAVEIDRRTMESDQGGSATRIEASHDGYANRYGLVHRRILIMRDEGGELRGEDLLIPVGRKGKRGKVPFAIRYHLGPGVEVGISESGNGAGLVLPDGSYWQYVAGIGAIEDCELVVEDSLWVDGDGKPHSVQQIVLQGLVSRGGGSFSWLFKRMG